MAILLHGIVVTLTLPYMLDLISILRVARTPDIDNSATQVLYLHLEKVDFDTQIVVLHTDMNYTNNKVLFSYRKHRYHDLISSIVSHTSGYCFRNFSKDIKRPLSILRKLSLLLQRHVGIILYLLEPIGPSFR